MKWLSFVLLILAGPVFAINLDGVSERAARENTRNVLRESFRLACRDYGEPDEARDVVAEDRRSLCACWERELGALRPEQVRRACSSGGDLDQWASLTRRLLESTSVEGYAGSSCSDALRSHRQHSIFFRALRRCQQEPLESLENLLFSREREEDPASCWRVTGMTFDGCLVSRSCTDRGARLSALGVTGPLAGETRREAVICNERLSQTHAFKDPQRVNRYSHEPLLQAHLPNAASVHAGGGYAQANCHGTAERLAGGLFGDVEVPQLNIAPLYDKECRPAAEAVFEKGRRGDASPTVETLGLSDGVGINMRYSGCGPEDCGAASMEVLWCHGGNLRSYTFINGMCISCWERKLQAKGFRRLSSSETWRGLYSGCVMTLNDHTITLLLASGGMCYFYESPSAGGAPQLLVETCPTLYARFPHRLCPAQPMTFQVQK